MKEHFKQAVLAIINGESLWHLWVKHLDGIDSQSLPDGAKHSFEWIQKTLHGRANENIKKVKNRPTGVEEAFRLARSGAHPVWMPPILEGMGEVTIRMIKSEVFLIYDKLTE